MGVCGHPEAANHVYLGLYAQQHRGQEGVGIVSANHEGRLFVQKGLGLVNDIFRSFDFDQLPGGSSIGHVRYTTAGGHKLANVHPLVAEVSSGRVAIAHNGNLINADSIRRRLIHEGSIFGSSVDTEVILHLMARARNDVPVEEAVIIALEQIRGAYSLLFLFEDRVMAVRDPAGLRPLAIGKVEDTYYLASETCAFDLIGAEYIRDVQPGELVVAKEGQELRSYYPFGRRKRSPCIFEYVYFSRPDSTVFGKNVYPIRKQLGHVLAREAPVEADMVIPVPDSGVPSALGFAEESKIPLELGLIRNHYVGRTFIEPQQSIRNFGVKVKLNANPEILSGKRIVIVDDSIVRGTTSRKLVSMLRKNGATEVHMRISAPPTTDPCYYGIDTPQKEELIAAKSTVDEIAEYLKVDSLAYLTLEGLYEAVGESTGSMCDACFTGDYPLGTPEKPREPTQENLFEVG